MNSLVNLKQKPKPAFDLYMGRENAWLDLPKSKWHNPFHLKRETDRPLCLKCHLVYALRSPLLADLHELDGLTLACYCKPKRCHAQTWLELRTLQIHDALTPDGKILSFESLASDDNIPFLFSLYPEELNVHRSF